jgi:16S rRNA (cytidine1402-2'-O)-methyltransferase
VLYEAPNRLAETLAAIEETGGRDRPAAVAREMTKQFEEVHRGTVGTLRAYYEGRTVRGEIVLVVGGAVPVAASQDVIRERVRALRSSGMSARDTAARVAEELGVAKRVAYRYAQEMPREIEPAQDGEPSEE